MPGAANQPQRVRDSFFFPFDAALMTSIPQAIIARLSRRAGAQRRESQHKTAASLRARPFACVAGTKQVLSTAGSIRFFRMILQLYSTYQRT
jgi:hypothetical protein